MLAATRALRPATTKPPEPPKPPKPPPGGPTVIFVPAVRAGNTPSGMPDRVSLRDPVYVTAVVTAPSPLTTPITIEVDGTSTSAGTATVNGAASIQITSTTPLVIHGTAMTAPNFPFSPFLQLGARWSGSLIGASNRFGVSSIMEDWSVIYEGTRSSPLGYDLLVMMDWVSDSGGSSATLANASTSNALQ